jgi:phage baseplate assembly protein W
MLIMAEFLGVPYPIRKTPFGFLYSQSGVDQIKSDLLTLLLTNPGERVMNPNFGTALRSLIFEPNDPTLQLKARNMIINSIKKWEPRIAIKQITVSSTVDKTILNSNDLQQDLEHILFIRILFVDPEKIKEVQELTLEVPIAGA